MSFPFILAVLLPALVYGQVTLTTPEPAWTVTCARDSMTITALAPADHADDHNYDNRVPRLALGEDTVPLQNPGVCTVDLDTNIAGDETCTDTGTGPCQSTLIVDLTTTATTSECLPNDAPAPDQDVTLARMYSKLVFWQTAAFINTDSNNLDGQGPDQNANTLRLFRVSCFFYTLEQQETGTGDVTIEALTEMPEEHTVALPSTTIAITEADGTTFTTNPNLGKEIRLTVGFTVPETTQYWEHMLVTSCTASDSASDGGSEVSMITNGCPEYSIDNKRIIRSIEYTIDTGPNNEVEWMHLNFRAFRIGTAKNLYIKCSVNICPTVTQTAFCQDLVLSGDPAHDTQTCSLATARRRYINLMSRNNQPETFASTISTVIVIESDNVIVDSQGAVAPGYTCLTTGTFTAVIAILSVLCLISVAVTVTVCIQGRGRSAPGKSSAMDIPPVGYNNYSVSKHSLNA